MGGFNTYIYIYIFIVYMLYMHVSKVTAYLDHTCYNCMFGNLRAQETMTMTSLV
jgi:hypothetical protein